MRLLSSPKLKSIPPEYFTLGVVITTLHPNETAYEGVESLERFNEDSFKEYCKTKLDSCDKHIEFIRRHCMQNTPNIRVLEIGSGSGKLLFRLEKEKLLANGVGLEMSGSRVVFSKKFAGFCDSVLVQTFCGDFMKMQRQDQDFDLIVGIDVVFNLIGGTGRTCEDDCIAKASAQLHPNGIIVFEVMTCQPELVRVKSTPEGFYRTWKSFDEPDPFQFGLDGLSMDNLGNLVWDKKFIDRKGGVSVFTNILKPYSESYIKRLFQKHGFKTQIFKQWADGDDTDDQEFIVLARKS